MALENCPKCEKTLPPPFASSGRQVCSSCGWSNKKKEDKTSKPELIHESNLSEASESNKVNSCSIKLTQSYPRPLL